MVPVLHGELGLPGRWGQVCEVAKRGRRPAVNERIRNVYKTFTTFYFEICADRGQLTYSTTGLGMPSPSAVPRRPRHID